MKKTLAQVMTKKRMELNLNLKDTAKKIGIDYVTLWKIESKGYTNLSYDTVAKLSKFLEISEKEVRDLC